MTNQARSHSPVCPARGTVLFLALVFAAIAAAVMLAVCAASYSNTQYTSSYVDRQGSYFTAKGLDETAFSQIWQNYLNLQAKSTTPTFPDTVMINSLAPTTPTATSFAWTQVSSSDRIAAGFALPPGGKVNGLFMDPAPNDGSVVYRADVSTSPILASWNNLGFGDMQAPPTGLRIYRRNRNATGNINTASQNVDLLFVSEAQRNVGGGTQNSTAGDGSYLASVVTLSNTPQFTGFNYAILTKNLTCTFCHLKVQDLGKAFNTNKSNYNTYNRVKVGTTQYMGSRNSATSSIEGTLYSRGVVAVENGANMTDAQFEGTATRPDGGTGTITTVAVNPNTNPATIAQNPATGAVSAGVTMTDSVGSGPGFPVDPKTGATLAVDPVTGQPITPPTPNGNLYLHYPLAAGSQTDGDLPDSKSFPAPFPDIPKPIGTGVTSLSNNQVDPDEVAAAVAKYGDSSAFIKGGLMVTGMTQAAPYSNNTLPSTSAPVPGQSVANISGANAFTGNVVLTGTQSNPIQINGTTVINGDVMINGYVEGTGQIYATGNIYIPGDVIYNNIGVNTSSEQFGQNADNISNGQNLLGLAAGKNIIGGDYLSQVTHWNSSLPQFYDPSPLTATQPQETAGLAGVAGTVDPGYGIPFVPGNPATGTPDTGTQNPYTDLNGMGKVKNLAGQTVGNSNMANFVVEQLATFNQQEFSQTLANLPVRTSSNTFTNAANYSSPNTFNYDPNLVPRYYSLYPSNFGPNAGQPDTQPVQLYVNNGSAWDSTNNRFNTSGDPHTYNVMTALSNIPNSVQGSPATTDPSTHLPDKTILNIHPEWMDANTMLQLLSSVEAQRVDNTPKRIDGLLYTNNALFAIERQHSQLYDPKSKTWSTVPSKSRGTMTINGAIIAPDLGVLVTGNATPALTVNYDARVKAFMPFTPKTTSWGYLRKGFTHGNGLP